MLARMADASQSAEILISQFKCICEIRFRVPNGWRDGECSTYLGLMGMEHPIRHVEQGDRHMERGPEAGKIAQVFFVSGSTIPDQKSPAVTN